MIFEARMFHTADEQEEAYEALLALSRRFPIKERLMTRAMVDDGDLLVILGYRAGDPVAAYFGSIGGKTAPLKVDTMAALEKHYLRHAYEHEDSSPDEDYRSEASYEDLPLREDGSIS